MSLFRSFVASTSALPSTAAAVSCSTSLRGLATAAPEASTSSSALVHPKGPTDVKHRWNRLVPKAIKARLPPAFINQNLDPKPVFPPKAPLETPAKFVGVIGRGIVKKLKGKVDLEMMAWEDLMNWRSKQWSEKGGLEPKDRRYLMWLIKMYKKGKDPRWLAIEPKKPKKYRAWGDAVQDGIRIPGARFKMDLTHARRPHGLPGFPFRGFKRE